MLNRVKTVLSSGEHAPGKVTVEGPIETYARQENKPIIKETIMPVYREEVQPEILREREQTEFREVIETHHEKLTLPTQYHTRELVPDDRGEARESNEDAERKLREYRENLPRPSSVVVQGEAVRQEKGACVHEFVDKRILEEVQPIVYRDVIEPHVTHVVKPYYERIIQAPTLKTSAVSSSKSYVEESTNVESQRPRRFVERFEREYVEIPEQDKYESVPQRRNKKFKWTKWVSPTTVFAFMLAYYSIAPVTAEKINIRTSPSGGMRQGRYMHAASMS